MKAAVAASGAPSAADRANAPGPWDPQSSERKAVFRPIATARKETGAPALT